MRTTISVAHDHLNTLQALAEFLQAAGIEHPDSLQTSHIACRLADNHVTLLSTVLPEMEHGALLGGKLERPVYRIAWPMADPDSFLQTRPLADALAQAQASAH